MDVRGDGPSLRACVFSAAELRLQTFQCAIDICADTLGCQLHHGRRNIRFNGIGDVGARTVSDHYKGCIQALDRWCPWWGFLAGNELVGQRLRLIAQMLDAIEHGVATLE